MTHHIAPTRDYVLVWAALVFLTFLTTFLGYQDLGPLNVFVAITIAVFKMSMVIWIFMGVRYQTKLTRLFVVAGFFWFGILIIIMGTDYVSRSWLPPGKMW